MVVFVITQSLLYKWKVFLCFALLLEKSVLAGVLDRSRPNLHKTAWITV